MLALQEQPQPEGRLERSCVHMQDHVVTAGRGSRVRSRSERRKMDILRLTSQKNILKTIKKGHNSETTIEFKMIITEVEF